MHCTYSGNRGEAIVAYLYDDITPFERAAFASHLGGCEVCRAELSDLRGVRTEMRDWAPPTFERRPAVLSPQPAAGTRQARSGFWAEMPVWMHTAAALLVVGVAAGAANVSVHHDATGFTVRTGWMQPAPAAQSAVDSQPWRAELAKLETEIQFSRTAAAQAVQTAAAVAPPRASASDDELLRKVKALLTESEKRQENELALRVAQVAREHQADRLADMTKIQNYLGAMSQTTTNTGFEVRRLQQNQDTLLHAVSQTVAVGNRN